MDPNRADRIPVDDLDGLTADLVLVEHDDVPVTLRGVDDVLVAVLDDPSLEWGLRRSLRAGAMVQVRWQNRTGMRTSSSAVLGWGSGPELLLDGVSGERQGERRSVRRSFTGSAQLVCVDDSGPRIVPVTVDDVSTDAVGLALGESDLSPVATAIILRFDHESPIVALVSPMRTQPGRSVLHIDRIASRDRARLATYVVGPRRGDTRRQAPAA